ncbi:hypothetical protein H0H93_011064 [Arthromyces matolae]|nr:hypothetical protein H0H93_011064 [Arthromyces matolae]
MADRRPALFPDGHDFHRKFGDTIGGSRVYDYTMKYAPDKPGEEHKENARVWNVLLDEAESHDKDMLRGFRDIIDGVLIFASLFSAVVTTLVAQTSQVLQPDDAQIMVSLLVESNQLLRAAGNATAINAVAQSKLVPGTVVHTSLDVWVDTLFLASLGLSLSTALLTVVVKQWLHVNISFSFYSVQFFTLLQAYSSFITGDARTRAFITDFRSEGLRIWRVREIVEALPLILHGSVLIFFVGLVLYVSQLSTPICVILVFITTLTFTFYLGSSFLPIMFPACPYKVPFLIKTGQTILLSVSSILVSMFSLEIMPRNFIPRWIGNIRHRIVVKCIHLRLFLQSIHYETLPALYTSNVRLVMFNSLERLLQRTSQRSTRLVVMEAVLALLLDAEEARHSLYQPHFDHTLLWDTLRFSLDEYAKLNNPTSPQVIIRTWENRITFLNEHVIVEHDEKLDFFVFSYLVAEHQGKESVCERILDWIGNSIFEDVHNVSRLLQFLGSCRTGNGVQQILNRTTQAANLVRMPVPWIGQSFLHYFIHCAYLDAAKAVVEADPSDEVVNSISPTGHTPLDIALGNEQVIDAAFVGYLMDNGARASQSSYEAAFLEGIKTCKMDPSLVRLLWSRRREVRLVDTRPDSWCMMSAVDVADKFLVEESQRPVLIQILQECDDHSGGQDQPPISPSVEVQSSHPHSISELEETVDNLPDPHFFMITES